MIQTHFISGAAMRAHRIQTERKAVTLMEVIFAIGVILTGLVGLAALIPLAADNAKSTMELDRSISESVSAASMASARSLTDPSQIVIFDKVVQGSPAVLNTSCRPNGSLSTLADRINASFVDGTFPVESPGYGHTEGFQGLLAGICIDPMGMPDLNLDTAFVANTSATPFVAEDPDDTAFDASRFPYYSERYDVLNAPNDAVGNPGGFVPSAAPTKAWPMGPRMIRATLKAPMRITVTASSRPTVSQPELLASAAIEKMFRSSGGTNSITGIEKEDPKSLLLGQSNSGGLSIDTSLVRQSRYSWFATLTPPFLGGESFRQSIVIVRDRVPPTPRRVNDVLALRKASYTVDSADENPGAERLTWVGNSIGFQGGAGGDIQIFGSQKIDDSVAVGEWVMLSRQRHRAVANGPTNRIWLADGPAVHRWFKVLRVSPAELSNTTPGWPHGTTPPTWSRWITLAGPDWVFRDVDTPPTGTPAPNTAIHHSFCTIVTGAISVIESEVVFDLP
jgi:hypothetical protein